MLLAATAVAVATTFLAGIAWAAIPASDGSISACYDRTGTLRVIDAEAGDVCNRRETELEWSQTGPAGPAGPAGPSDAYVMTLSPLSPLEDGVTTSMDSMNVPAGNYVIDAQVRVRSQVVVAGVSISCDLFAGGVQLDIFRVEFGPGGSFSEQVMPLAGWAELASAGTVEVVCRADQQDDFSTLGVFESPVIAIKVGSITVAP